jgi:ligand-binding sensor domain-containing protein
VRIVLLVGLVLPCGHRSALAAQHAATPGTAGAPVSLTDYTLTNWSEEQGPFPFGIYAIAQDRDGYLWLGARTGLVRFDGSEFVLWKGRQRLPDERVAAILAAHDGSLWVGFGTVGGVAQIVDRTARQFTAKDGLAEGDVNAIVQDPGATIWVASHGGLSRYDGQRWRVVGEDEGLPRAPVLGLWCDSRGRLWVGTATGLYRRAADDRTFTLIELGSDGDVAEDLAGTVWGSDPDEVFRIVGRPRSGNAQSPRRTGAGRGLLIDRSGSLWVGTRGAGLMRVHGDSEGVTPERIEHLTRRQGLLSDEVRALFQDRNGSLWIGSRRGLSRLSESNIKAVLNAGGSDVGSNMGLLVSII